MDVLKEMLDKQTELQNRLGTLDFKNDRERTLFIKHHAQYLDQELHEMMYELPFFKEWKNYESWPPNYERKAKEEFIDAFHFMLNIGIALGMNHEDIYKEYCRKNKINHERQDGDY